MWLFLMVDGVSRRNMLGKAVLRGLTVGGLGVLLGGCDEFMEKADGGEKYRVVSSDEIMANNKKSKDKNEREDAVSMSGRGVIVLDPGHGFGNKSRKVFDPGACYPLGSPAKFKEADIVLGQAYKIKGLLESVGYDVHLARKDNKVYVSRSDRVKLAEKLGARALISLHVNSFDNPKACGQLVLYGKGSDAEKESRDLGESIHGYLLKEIGKRHKVNGRGVRTDVDERKKKLRMLYSKVPSVIVEPGFLSNPGDRRFLIDNVFDVEYAVAKGVHDYLSRVAK